MNFFDVLGEMLVILFAIVAGFAAKRLGYLGGETDQKLSKLLLNITMPSMILASVITGDELPEAGVILSVLEVGAVFYVLSFAVALAVPRFLPGTPAQKGVWRYALSFPNVGFIGYPVAMALFGQEALFYAVVLALPFNVLSYSLGPLMLAGMARFRWKQLLSPCIVASVGALVLALTRLRPPARRARCWTSWAPSPCRCPCWWWAPSWRTSRQGRCSAPPSCGCCPSCGCWCCRWCCGPSCGP